MLRVVPSKVRVFSSEALSKFFDCYFSSNVTGIVSSATGIRVSSLYLCDDAAFFAHDAM